MDDSMAVATFRLSIRDIFNGDGIATVTLRSGVQFVGSVNWQLSKDDVLHLNTDKGWHTIDWAEVVAVSGEARPVR